MRRRYALREVRSIRNVLFTLLLVSVWAASGVFGAYLKGESASQSEQACYRQVDEFDSNEGDEDSSQTEHQEVARQERSR